MKNILIFFALCFPAMAMAQLPTISGNTLFKLQKENVTWLAPIDSLVSFIGGGNGIYGGNGTLPAGGTDVAIPGQYQPLRLNMTVTGGGAWAAFEATTNTSSDEAQSRYLVGRSPQDSFFIYSYDNGTTIRQEGGPLTIWADNLTIQNPDSMQITGVPSRTIASDILARDASGYVRGLQGESSGQILKWNGTNWALAADSTGGGGEANTASNVGGGAGTIFVQKAGVNLEFKTITATGGMNLSNASSVITLSTKAPQPPASENVHTSNFSATNLTLDQVDCSGGAISVTPPPLPSIGNRFAVVDARAASATNNITINFSGSSQKLYGSVQNYIINLNGGYAEFIFMGSSTGWVATKG